MHHIPLYKLEVQLTFLLNLIMRPEHAPTLTHTETKHTMAWCALSSWTFCSFYLLFSALYSQLPLTHMASGCELMRRVENSRRRSGSREEVEGEGGEGRKEGDVETCGESRVFTMHFGLVQRRSETEIATALEQSCGAYMSASENIWEKYGWLLWLNGCTCRRRWTAVEQGALHFVQNGCWRRPLAP